MKIKNHRGRPDKDNLYALKAGEYKIVPINWRSQVYETARRKGYKVVTRIKRDIKGDKLEIERPRQTRRERA